MRTRPLPLHGLLAAALSLLAGCAATPQGPAALEELALAEVERMNSDLRADRLTMDLGILIPSNLDPSFELVSVEQLLEGVREAKRIFGAVDVQIRLLWVRTGPVDERHLSVPFTEAPTEPASDHAGFYENLHRHPKRISDEALAVFERLVPHEPDNDRTIYLVVLQDVFYPYFEPTDTGDFALRVTPTSGLSFPPYMCGETLPRRLRGVITISNLTRGANRSKTIAHEIGHKTINVSHEHRGTAPGFEVVGEGGLMIYGAGVEIASGQAGRWHRERLERSPFLYRLGEGGQKLWNPDYEEGGHYADPVYAGLAMPDGSSGEPVD